MKKLNLTLIAAFVFSINGFALNIDEAVNIALEKNLDVATKQYEYKESKQNQYINAGSMLPKIDLTYSYNDRNELISGQIDEDSTATATLSYNVFNGFKDISNLNSSKYLSKSSLYYLNAMKQDISLDTKSAYINYLDSKKSLQTYEDAFILFDRQYMDAKSQFEQGIIAKNDLLEVEINMLDSKQNVVLAKSNVKIARYELSNILGGYDLSNVSIEDINPVPFMVSRFTDEGLSQRSELQALTLNLRSAKSLTDASRSSYYPTVDASIDHNQYGEDASIGGRTGYPDNQEVLNVTAKWNLFNGMSDVHRVELNKTRIQKAVVALEQMKLTIKLQYEKAVAKLDVSTLNFKTSKLALAQAKENYNIVNSRFQEGVSSNTDLIDANYLLSQAKQRFHKSYYDKYLALATLQRVLEVQ